MDVIVVEDSVSEALVLERQITALGHNVRGARSGSKAVELMKERLPNLLVTDGMVPELSGEALTRLVRSQEAARYVYVLYVTSKTGQEAMKAAFAAGADDFMVKPLGHDELVARLRVADRIISRETRLRTKVRDLETALRRLEAAAAMAGNAAVARAAGTPSTDMGDDSRVPRELAEKPSWRRIDAAVQRMLADFLGKELKAQARGDFAPTLARAITLTSVSLVTEIRLTISAEKASLQEIAVGLFGPDPDDALVEDTLSEIANLVMGGVKMSLSEDGVSLTSGLPAGVPPQEVESAALYRREQLFGSSEGIRLGLRVEVSRCPTRKVRSFELSDGMIFASAVTNDAGMMLVAGGVRLSTVTIEKITRSLPDGHFEVLVPR